jgi:glycerol uptake facilitator-like aquaporin
MQWFVLEMLLTALLMFVILSVSTGAREKGITAGSAVGAGIALEALFAGPICGASMNPARSLAPGVSFRTFQRFVDLSCGISSRRHSRRDRVPLCAGTRLLLRC